MRRVLTAAAACLLMWCSCNDGDVNTTYCSLPARLVVENVQQAPVLYTACQSMDEFCTVTAESSRFAFTSQTGRTSYIDLTAYSGYYLGLSGFIVGKPSIPEMGKDVSTVVCYDLACSNCYQDYHITKPLVLQSGGYAYCKNCCRTYQLTNSGIVSKGNAGRNLYRYRVSYVGYALVINNG